MDAKPTLVVYEYATVVEQVYTRDLKSLGATSIRVQISSVALKTSLKVKYKGGANLYNVIKKSDYYVRVNNSVPTLVTTLDKATLFKVGEAEKYIKNQIKKSHRSEYNIVQTDIEDKPTKITDIPQPEFTQKKLNSALSQINTVIHNKLSEQREIYRDKLKYYDDVILDIRHYIRDESTRLNACQAANVLYRLQRIERKRVEVKRELQRIDYVFSTISSAISNADKFHYEPYKPRVIQDMEEFLSKKVV